MAHIYREANPDHRGEVDLANRLRSLADEKLHLWFSLDFIPKVYDVDVFLLHEEVCAAAIEVKAVTIDAVLSFGFERCEIREGPGVRASTTPPHMQASRAKGAIFNFLKPYGGKAIWVAHTACWPLISRREWNQRWDDPRVTDGFSESMIFRDDLASPSAFQQRLAFIRENPPSGPGPTYRALFRPEHLENLKNAFHRVAQPRAAPSDLDRLRTLEAQAATDARKDAPPEKDVRLLFRGYPGTGKTFRLLAIGMAHALAGKRVLYACFNKVLAADIARVLVHSSRLPQAKGRFQVHDVYELFIDYAERRKLRFTEDDEFAEYENEIVGDASAHRNLLGEYDSVLIDEAQDMTDSQLKLIELQLRDGGTICVASGPGQELYKGADRTWLKAFSDRSDTVTKQLRRNFRNTRIVFQAAHVFYEAFPDTTKIASAAQRFNSPKTSKQSEMEQLEFLRPDGEIPLVEYIDESAVDWKNASFIAEAQHDAIVSTYESIFRRELQRMTENLSDRPMDLLILAPSENSSERAWAVEALERIDQDFIDYAAAGSGRRAIALPETVRLCTFHSSRGIEGTRVLVLGFDGLPEKGTTSPNNLGYITLSRAVVECILIARSTTKTGPVAFVKSVLAALA